MAVKSKTKTMKRIQLLDPTPSDKSVLELGRERVSAAFDRFDHIAVMFSGGKDSTCVLHLAYDEHVKRFGTDGKQLDVIFFDEEAIPYETVDYVRDVMTWPGISMRWYCIPVRHVNACSPDEPYWYPWDPDKKDVWTREFPEEGIWIDQFPVWDFAPVENRLAMPELNALLFNVQEHGTVGLLMGIRADESMTRRRSVLRRKEDNWIVPFVRESYAMCRYPGCDQKVATPTSKTCMDHRGRRLPSQDVTDIHNVFKCYPIYDWVTADVWTFAREFGIHPVTGAPCYNTGYDLLEMTGLPHSRQRCAPPFGNEPMTSLWTFKTCFPDLWDKMVDRVAGAATAARYASGPLYSHGERPRVADADWWDDQAWLALIKELLENHEEEPRKLTAKRIKIIMERHNAKTTSAKTGAPDHILPDIPHPVTGLSWQFLAMVALRGDPKQRKNPEWQVAQRGDPNKLGQIRQRYIDGVRAKLDWMKTNSAEKRAS